MAPKAGQTNRRIAPILNACAWSDPDIRTGGSCWLYTPGMAPETVSWPHDGEKKAEPNSPKKVCRLGPTHTDLSPRPSAMIIRADHRFLFFALDLQILRSTSQPNAPQSGPSSPPTRDDRNAAEHGAVQVLPAGTRLWLGSCFFRVSPHELEIQRWGWWMAVVGAEVGSG